MRTLCFYCRERQPGDGEASLNDDLDDDDDDDGIDNLDDDCIEGSDGKKTAKHENNTN